MQNPYIYNVTKVGVVVHNQTQLEIILSAMGTIKKIMQAHPSVQQ